MTNWFRLKLTLKLSCFVNKSVVFLDPKSKDILSALRVVFPSNLSNLRLGKDNLESRPICISFLEGPVLKFLLSLIFWTDEIGLLWDASFLNEEPE